MFTSIFGISYGLMTDLGLIMWGYFDSLCPLSYFYYSHIFHIKKAYLPIFTQRSHIYSIDIVQVTKKHYLCTRNHKKSVII